MPDAGTNRRTAKLGRAAGDKMASKKEISDNKKGFDAKIVRGKGRVPIIKIRCKRNVIGRGRPTALHLDLGEGFQNPRLRTRDQRLNDITAELGRGDPRIVVSEDGGPLRLIINGRHVKPTGRYPCFKGPVSLPYEADHEMALFEHSDVDKAVVSCLSQPHRVVIPVAWQNKPLMYFPDLRRDLADGTVEIIETKRDDDRRLQEPHYRYKLDAVREVYRSEGMKFRILGRSEIMKSQLYKNAHEFGAWAFAKVSPARKFVVEAAIADAGGTLPYAKAAELAGGTAILHALVIRRSIYFDLTMPPEDDLPVMLVDHDALRRSSPPLL
jgi:hypothetical protein